MSISTIAPSQSIAVPNSLLQQTSCVPLLVLFDYRVSDLEVLYRALVPEAIAYTLDAETDALSAITQWLSDTGATRLAIVAHGEPGIVQLGANPLTLAQVQARSALLQEWGVESIALYSCEVAKGDSGQAFVQQLSAVTGAVIAATATKTGSATLGGNWELEVRTGKASTLLAFEPEVMSVYTAVLAADDFDPTFCTDDKATTDFSFTTELLKQAISLAEDWLQNFAQDSNFSNVLKESFGDRFSQEQAEALRQAWTAGDFTQLPTIQIKSGNVLQSANGAYAAQTNQIYLSQRYLEANASNPEAIATVLLEEIGHFVDSKINRVDTPGDEGEVFAAVVQGVELTPHDLNILRTEDDAAIIQIDGEYIIIEQALPLTTFNTWNELFDRLGQEGYPLSSDVKTALQNIIGASFLPIQAEATSANDIFLKYVGQVDVVSVINNIASKIGLPSTNKTLSITNPGIKITEEGSKYEVYIGGVAPDQVIDILDDLTGFGMPSNLKTKLESYGDVGFLLSDDKLLLTYQDDIQLDLADIIGDVTGNIDFINSFIDKITTKIVGANPLTFSQTQLGIIDQGDSTDFILKSNLNDKKEINVNYNSTGNIILGYEIGDLNFRDFATDIPILDVLNPFELDNVKLITAKDAVTSYEYAGLGNINLVSGFNLIGQMDFTQAPDNTFGAFINDYLKINSLGVHLGLDPTKQLSLTGVLGLNLPLFKIGDVELIFKQAELGIDISTTGTTVGIGGGFTLAGYDPTQDEEPTLNVGGKISFDLVKQQLGALLEITVPDGSWKNPFGLPNSSISQLKLDLGGSYKPTWIEKVGFIADVKYGDFDIDLAASVNINDPQEIGFALTLEQAIDFSDLIIGPLSPFVKEIPLISRPIGFIDQILDSKITFIDENKDNVADKPLISFIPLPNTTIADKPFAQGIGINGKASVLGKTASLSFNADISGSSIDANLQLSEIVVGDILEIGGSEPGTDLVLKLKIDANDPSNNLYLAGDGRLKLLGQTIASSAFKLNSESLSIIDLDLSLAQYGLNIENLDLDVNWKQGVAKGSLDSLSWLGTQASVGSLDWQQGSFKITNFDLDIFSLLKLDLDYLAGDFAQSTFRGYGSINFLNKKVAAADIQLKEGGSFAIKDLTVDLPGLNVDIDSFTITDKSATGLGSISLLGNKTSVKSFSLNGSSFDINGLSVGVLGNNIKLDFSKLSINNNLGFQAAGSVSLFDKNLTSTTVNLDRNGTLDIKGSLGISVDLDFPISKSVESFLGIDIPNSLNLNTTVKVSTGSNSSGNLKLSFEALGHKFTVDTALSQSSNFNSIVDSIVDAIKNYIGRIPSAPGIDFVVDTFNDLVDGISNLADGALAVVDGFVDKFDKVSGEIAGGITQAGEFASDLANTLGVKELAPYVAGTTETLANFVQDFEEDLKTATSYATGKTETKRRDVDKPQSFTVNQSDREIIVSWKDGILPTSGMKLLIDSVVDNGTNYLVIQAPQFTRRIVVADKYKVKDVDDGYGINLQWVDIGDVEQDITFPNNWRIPVNDIDKITIVGTAYNDQIYVAPSISQVIDVDAKGGNDKIQGGLGNDILRGGSGVDIIAGGAGNDYLYGGDHDDTILGEDGNDTIEGGAGVNTIDGGADDDTVYGGEQKDIILGGSGDDLLDGKGGEDQILGGDGNDTIYGGGEKDTIDGGSNNDTIYGGDADDFLKGGTGNDIIDGEGGNDDILGDSGEDILKGGSGDDLLRGGDDKDEILGGSGADFLLGEGGDDTLRGGDDSDLSDGNDILDGGIGTNSLYGGRSSATQGHYRGTTNFQEKADVLVSSNGGGIFNGESGPDYLKGGSGSDTLRGNDGDDTINGYGSKDYIYGDSGVDYLYGNEGDDEIWGGSDNDFLFGDVGIDSLTGEGGNDYISGGSNKDYIYGIEGVDSLFGDSGDDEIWGGSDGDLLDGGIGIDILRGDDGNDTIFGGADNDTLDGGKDNDVLYGNSGTDNLKGETGDDFLDGGDDDDILYGGLGDIYNSTDGNDTLKGGSGHDSLYGENGLDVLYGEEGNDLLKGHYGDDSLYGGAGTDTLYGGWDNDLLDGGIEHDSLYGEAGTDTLRGGDGDDLLEGGTENDFLYGDAGIDTLVAGEGDDRLEGGTENDFLYGDAGTDTLFGGEGDDLLEGGTENDFLYGDAGADTLRGSEGDDLLDGGTGNDTLYGGVGIDTLIGGEGSDRLEGGTENDSLYGDAGTDTLVGGEGNDLLEGGTGNDDLYGEAGADALKGGTGNDLLEGGTGNDSLYGEAGVDTLIAGDGDDRLEGGTEADYLKGGAGSDTLYGDDGDDVIFGSDANQLLTYGDHDTIYGGAGNDTITPGWGDDVVDGGAGIDTLVIDYSSLPTQAVAWQEQDPNTASFDVYVGNAYGIGTPIKTNINILYGNYHVAISADGLTVAGSGSLGSYSSGNQGLWVQKIHSSDPAVRVIPTDQGGNPMLSGNGSKVVWSQGDSVWTANTNGTQVRQLTNLSGSYAYGDGDHLATISEDGSTIAWSRTKSTGSYDFTRTILIANIDGTNLRQIDISGGYVQGLDLSADGSKVTWSQVGVGSPGGVWVANTDGTNKRELSGNLNAYNIYPSISDDGSRVVWTGFAGAGYSQTNIYAANTDGSRLWAVPNTQDAGSVGSSSLSGDGKRVTFSQFVRTDANNIRTWGLYTTSVDGTEPSILVDTISTNYDYGGSAALSSYVDIGVRYNSFDLATGSGEIYTWGPSRIRYSNVERFDITGTRYGDELFGGNLDDSLTGGGGADTLKGGLGNDIYQLDLITAAGSQIQDTGGIDALNLTGGNLSLSTFKRYGTELVIDINQDGIANPINDITILDFFASTGAGLGFIESIGNFSGTAILNSLDSDNQTAVLDGTQVSTLGAGNFI